MLKTNASGRPCIVLKTNACGRPRPVLKTTAGGGACLLLKRNAFVGVGRGAILHWKQLRLGGGKLCLGLETTVPLFVLLQEIINGPLIKAAGATAV
jgi:hypothetical protein